MSKTPRTDALIHEHRHDDDPCWWMEEMRKIELELDQWREVAEELAKHLEEFRVIIADESSAQTLAKFDALKEGSK